METKLFTLGYDTSPIYASGVQWAFVSKVEEGYKLLHGPMTCKDYTHEIICNSVHKSGLYVNGVSNVLPLNLEKLQLALIVPIVATDNGKDITKDIVYNAKKMFSTFEISGGLPKTLIKEVTLDNDDTKKRVFILTMKKHMVESPVLFHSLLALIRTAVVYKKIITKDNAVETFKNEYKKDSNILYDLLSSNTLELLLKEHKTIFSGGIDLTLIYPERSQSTASYHSGFGPVAMRDKNLCSKWYGDAINDLLIKHKIKFP